MLILLLNKYQNVLKENNRYLLSIVYKELHKIGFFEKEISKESINITNENLLFSKLNYIKVGYNSYNNLSILINKENITLDVYCSINTINNISDFNDFIKECSIILTKTIEINNDNKIKKHIEIRNSYGSMLNSVYISYYENEILFNSTSLIIYENEKINLKYKNEVKEERYNLNTDFFSKISKINNLENHIEEILDFLYLKKDFSKETKELFLLSEDILENNINKTKEYLLNLNEFNINILEDKKIA